MTSSYGQFQPLHNRFCPYEFSVRKNIPFPILATIFSRMKDDKNEPDQKKNFLTA